MKTYFRFFVIFLVFSCWISYTASAQVVLIYTGNTSTVWITPAEATTEAGTTKSLLQVAGIQAEITENENRVKQWMLQTTSDGSVDVLILYGVIPTTIYPSGNAMPDGSVAEDWIETSDGNTILNHADYFGYRSTGRISNGAGGLQNLMDIPNISLFFPNIPMFVTLDGSTLTPSLVDFQSTRALPLNQLEGDWFAEKILASNTGDARATLADPVVVRDGNRGRIAIVHQTVFEDNPNGEVAAEIIVNYLLADATAPSPDLASKGVIPDAGLAAAVRKALDLAPNAPITKQAMQRLTTLDAADRQITNLTGLEHATQLEALILSGNQIRDIRPLAGLTALMVLGLQDNQIEDLDPLTKLTQLQVLSLNNNQIRYVGPLARLTRLKELRLAQNKIRDVSKFTGLVNLETLSLAENPITDMSPLASLTKLVEVDIEIIPPASKGVIPDAGLAAAVRKALDLAPNAPITKQAMQRLTTLDAADRQITNLTGLEHATQLEALILSGNQIRDIRPLAGLTALMVLGLQDNQIEDLDPLTKLTQLQVLSLNNNQIRYVGPLARLTRLKELRLAQNKIRDVSKFTGLVNLETLSLAENPITDMSPLASLKKLVEVDIETEVVPIIDAVLSISPSPVASPAIGELLTLSLNIGTDEMVAGYQVTLQFDATALRYVESSNGDYLPDGAFFVPPVVNRGRLELASSALAGVSEGDGTLATITFEVLAVKASTLTLSETLLSDDQGNTFRPRVEQGEVTEPPKLKGDVNGDGVVNVQDLVLVGLSFGKTGQDAADINGDGVVNIGDLVLVAGALGDVAAAPAVYAASMEPFTAQEVRQWLIEARLSGENSLAYRRGIFMLEQLLMALMPKETALLPNYPNPFNPETWIPYELATDTHVRITIYNTQGVVIRTLQFGHQSAGYYTGRDRAAYWDGRNALGEQVASGLYFYQLETDEMSFTAENGYFEVAIGSRQSAVGKMAVSGQLSAISR